MKRAKMEKSKCLDCLIYLSNICFSPSLFARLNDASKISDVFINQYFIPREIV